MPVAVKAGARVRIHTRNLNFPGETGIVGRKFRGRWMVRLDNYPATISVDEENLVVL